MQVRKPEAAEERPRDIGTLKSRAGPAEEGEVTLAKYRCGGCSSFPGNGKVCPQRPRRKGERKVKVYELDYGCENREGR